MATETVVRRVLITGAAGFVGAKVVARMATDPEFQVTGSDIRAPESVPAGVNFVALDLRNTAGINDLVAQVQPHAIVHLAAIVVPPPGMSRETMRAIDVGGTEALLYAAVRHGVEQVVVTSSGAAYGYYADNPEWIDEDCAIRGNEEFPYAAHKREVEQILAMFRERHPELKQLILRPGTVLGPNVSNHITAIFARKRLLGIRGARSPFVFIWVDDLVEIVVRGVRECKTGIYNVAGDGAMDLTEIAAVLGKPILWLPASLLWVALAVLQPLGLVPWGPEQLRFLRYRPVLNNHRLKHEFGYTPLKDSRAAFAALLEAQPQLKSGGG